MRRRVAWMTAMLLAGGSLVGAQSLAEIARKELARREALDKKGDSFNERDLNSLDGERQASTVVGDTAGDSEAEDGAEQALPDDPTQTRDYWQGRLSPYDSRIAELEAKLQSPEYQNDPMGYAQRQRMESDLTKARADRQAVLDEGRTKGVPPGWLR